MSAALLMQPLTLSEAAPQLDLTREVSDMGSEDDVERVMVLPETGQPHANNNRLPKQVATPHLPS